MKASGISTLALMILGVLATALPVCTSWPVRLIYNPTDSAPRGWYRVTPVDRVVVDDYVIARLPEDVALLATSRGYLPATVPLLKRVAAASGAVVCSHSGVISIDGRSAARAMRSDRAGRALPSWSGCRVLAQDEVFLLSTHPSSFDSRYFGPLHVRSINGTALPLWIWR